MIIHKSFKHGWFYHYRVHVTKTDQLCGKNFSPLRYYLHDVREHCPHEYFEKGPRGSGVKKVLAVDLQKIKGHEVCALAEAGLDLDQYGTAHTNVQMFMLQHDDKTISVEVPIWMLEKEFPQYESLLQSTETLTGHIDALRIEDGAVWVWDYKPRAHLEKYAATQTQLYALMLSTRTGIPIEKFRCGYFDDEVAYVFKPLATPEWK